jgi:hypothetical protein
LTAVVADCDDSPRLAVKHELRACDIDHELAAISTQEPVIQVARHHRHARDRIPGEFVAKRDVSIPAPRLQEHFDSLTDELVTRVARETLEAFVRVADNAVLIDEGDPIRHHLEQLV